MAQNLTTDQVFDMLSGLVETGKSFAENVSMDTLFSSKDEPKSGPYSDPMSRRNDVGAYANAPYQANQQHAYPAQSGNPYTYGYGYASDPVRYNSNQGYFNSNPYRGNSYGATRRFNDGAPNGYANGSVSSTYGMSGTHSAPPVNNQPNPYQSSYDERNYRFPETEFGFNRGGGFGW